MNAYIYIANTLIRTLDFLQILLFLLFILSVFSSSFYYKEMTGRAGGSCAACKHQRRKCHPDCALAPHFPPDRAREFQDVHRLFGLSNFMRFYNMASSELRDDTVESLVFEAEARRRDPVHGAAGVVHNLTQRVEAAHKELALLQHQLLICKQRQQQEQQLLALHQQLLAQPPPDAVFANQVNVGVDAGRSRTNEAASLIQMPENNEDMKSFQGTSSFSAADLQLYKELLNSKNPAASFAASELHEPKLSNVYAR